MSGHWVIAITVFAAVVAFGDLVSEELRARLDRLPEYLIRFAVLRLPPEFRQGRRDEWLLELWGVLQERKIAAFPLTRLFHGICYATSLLLGARQVGKDLSPTAQRPLGAARRIFGSRPVRTVIGTIIGVPLGLIWMSVLMSGLVGNEILYAARSNPSEYSNIIGSTVVLIALVIASPIIHELCGLIANNRVASCTVAASVASGISTSMAVMVLLHSLNPDIELGLGVYGRVFPLLGLLVGTCIVWGSMEGRRLNAAARATGLALILGLSSVAYINIVLSDALGVPRTSQPFRWAVGATVAVISIGVIGGRILGYLSTPMGARLFGGIVGLHVVAVFAATTAGVLITRASIDPRISGILAVLILGCGTWAGTAYSTPPGPRSRLAR